MSKQPVSRQEHRKALREDLRFRLLRALDAGGDPSQRRLAEATGVSLGAANALLNGLIEAGLVHIGVPEAPPTRLRIRYELTKAGRAELERLAGPYLARRRADRDALDREIAALENDDKPDDRRDA